MNLINQILLNDDAFKVDQAIIKKILLTDKIFSPDRINLFIKYPSIFNLNTIDEFLNQLSSNYADIANRKIKALIDNNLQNKKLLEILINMNYISSFSEERKGLRVNHKRN